MKFRKRDMKASAGRILMIVENPYPQDTRVRNEANKLYNAGYSVSVIAKKYPNQPLTENVFGVNVYRVPWFEVFKKSTESKSFIIRLFYKIATKLGYIIEYFYFTFAAFIYSFYVLIKDGFDVIHQHNPPNTLFVIGLFYRLLGKKFVFDHHDLSPELYLSRYKTNGGIIHKALLLEEKLCLRSANIIIATNESYKEIDIKRGKKNPDDIFIVRNGPDLNLFKEVEPDKELKSTGKKILVYIGVMGPQDGVDYLLRSLHILVNEFNRKDFHCVIIGPGDSLEDLKKLREELNLQEYCRFTGKIPFADLLKYLSTADICVDPNPSNPLNDYSTWIKVMEYMSLGKPIVSYNLRETRYSAQQAALYATPNDEREFAQRIIELMDNPQLREEMGKFGKQRVKNELAWEIVSENLLKAYRKLLPDKIPLKAETSSAI
uniref:Glycosyltransferase WbuB n=1 Tax=Ignavibacterium album TaxID=591197 RepID=A0A832DJV9_9BACT